MRRGWIAGSSPAMTGVIVALLRIHSIPNHRKTYALFEPGEFGHRLQLLGVARDRVQQQMSGTGGDQILEPLAHLLGRAVDARRVGAGRIVVDLGEPAVELAT